MFQSSFVSFVANKITIFKLCITLNMVYKLYNYETITNYLHRVKKTIGFGAVVTKKYGFLFVRSPFHPSFDRKKSTINNSTLLLNVLKRKLVFYFSLL